MAEPVCSGTTAFVGSIPDNYDRYMVPLFFEPYADDLVARLPLKPSMRVLETACGTGVVTERLLERIGDGTLVATDFNEPMLERSKARVPDQPHLERRQADATNLPFGEHSFDAVLCQFGVMFFPDKAAAFREAVRVLKPGGLFLFNVWDRLEVNPLQQLADETVAAFFPSDPPRFYRTPSSLDDPAVVVPLLEDSALADIRWERVERLSESPSAQEVASALLEGTPMFGQIMERRPEALPAIREAFIQNIRSKVGDSPVRAPMQAIVFEARRIG